MLASHKWLEQLSGLHLEVADVSRRLTDLGLEVESVQSYGEGLDGVIVAEVLGSRAHPKRDNLQIVTVSDGQSKHDIVCGASNVPDPGGRVLLAQLGAKLPNGMEITERKLGGEVSRGMLCGETELGIGSDDSGLLVLESDLSAPPGTAVVDALDLEDHVYEIGLTPNRPDCLGHVGIARELGVAYGKPLELDDVPAVGRLIYPDQFLFPQSDATFSLSNMWDTKRSAEVFRITEFEAVRVDIEAPERCPRYGAALVANVDIAPSSFAVRYRLHVLGLRAINNVVDATNLIMLGFGHPIHAFDYDNVRGSRIVVRLASEGERFTTLDGVERTLTADDLLICDAEGPVALAGVMGGENSEINIATRRVLIECAYFDPRSVRRTSKRTGLHTDSSHRFERGVDPGDVRHVLGHAASMLSEMGGGVLVESALDVNPVPIERKVIALRPRRVKLLLGTDVPEPEMRTLFEGIGCKVTASPVGLDVTAPTHRPDLLREVDLIEEVARLRGYDLIPTQLPTVRPSSAGGGDDVSLVRRLRELGAAAGLDEAINYAFVSPADLASAGVSEAAVGLANPMSEERSVLRTSLLPGLAANLRHAQRHQATRLLHFEVARVFEPGDGRLPAESYRLSIMLWGDSQPWFQKGERFDFYDLKGFVEAVLGPLLGQLPTTVASQGALRPPAHMHPQRSALVVLGDRVVGYLGQLHPEVAERLGLEGEALHADLDVAEIGSLVAARGPSLAVDIARFPSVTRDLAVVVGEATEAGAVAEALAVAGGKLVEDVRLFDIYRGNPVDEGHKSLAFHVVYRDPAATLTDKIVDKAHAQVVKAAERSFGASVRK